MQFEFNQQLMPQSVIDIPEIGEFGLEGMNDEGYSYFMVIKTMLGTAIVATCGPVIPDINQLPTGFKMTLDKMPYKEEKLAKTISYFLNERNKGITSARLLDYDDAVSQFRELKIYLANLTQENF